QWRPAILPLKLLCLSAGIRSVTPVLTQLLTVMKDTRRTMWRTVVAACILPPSFWIAARWGTLGLSGACLILFPIVVTLPLWHRVFNCTRLSLRQYFGALQPAFEGCLVM